MSFFNTMGMIGPDVISKAFSNAVPTSRVTNPNAKKLGKGKTAKSKKRRMREAQMQFQQQPQMSFADQRQLQNDQFKFLQDNIFGRSGAVRRTIGGQLEQDVPQGMDYFKNTGPDRQSVKDRQARVDSTSLNQPGVWNQAQQAVNDAKRSQGWISPTQPPPAPPGPSMDQVLRQDNGAVGYFNDPAYNSVNPRTGLVTNDGPFNLSRDTPYGPARSYFEGSKGNISKEPANVPVVNPGPVSNLFQGGFQNYNQAVNDALQKTAPQNTVPYRPAGDTQAVFTPQAGLTPPSPMNEAPSVVNPAVPFGAPNITWGDIVPQGPSKPLFDLFDTNPQTGNEQIAWQRLFDTFTPKPQLQDTKRPFYPQGF